MDGDSACKEGGGWREAEKGKGSRKKPHFPPGLLLREGRRQEAAAAMPSVPPDERRTGTG